MMQLLTITCFLLVHTTRAQDFIFPDSLDQMSTRKPDHLKEIPPAVGLAPQSEPPPVQNEVLPVVPLPPQSVLYRGLAGGIASPNNISDVISNGVTSVALKLNKGLNIGHYRSAYEDYSSLVYSPLNIAEALSLVMLGAANKTYYEVAHFLNFTSVGQNSHSLHEEFGRLLKQFAVESAMHPDNPKITAAAGVFVQKGYPIREEFRKLAIEAYESEIQTLDFMNDASEARDIINHWVSKKTNGKIDLLLPTSPSPNTKVLLTSALYFRGLWKTPFIDTATMRRPFYPYGRQNGTSVEVDMMAGYGTFKHYVDTKFPVEIVALPYKGDTTAMYLIIPKNSNKLRVMNVERLLTPGEIERMISRMKPRNMILTLPKMRLESSLHLTETLKRFGVNDLFDPEKSNLGVLSAGTGTALKSRFGGDESNNADVKIKSNCTNIFDSKNRVINDCIDQLPKPYNNRTKVIYKRFGSKIGRRFARHLIRKRRQQQGTIDTIRQQVEASGVNPRLYADDVIHKVFIDITETGTEAAAATDVSISRAAIYTLRIDHPFMFFIRHNESKLNLFWGSVIVPTPYY